MLTYSSRRTQILTTIYSVLSVTPLDPSIKLHHNPLINFGVLLLTNKHINRQTNATENIASVARGNQQNNILGLLHSCFSCKQLNLSVCQRPPRPLHLTKGPPLTFDAVYFYCLTTIQWHLVHTTHNNQHTRLLIPTHSKCLSCLFSCKSNQLFSYTKQSNTKTIHTSIIQQMHYFQILSVFYPRSGLLFDVKIYSWFKQDLDRNTTHPRLDPTKAQTHDLQIMTVHLMSLRHLL